MSSRLVTVCVLNPLSRHPSTSGALSRIGALAPSFVSSLQQEVSKNQALRKLKFVVKAPSFLCEKPN